MSRASTPAPGSTVSGIPTLEPVVVQPSSKAQNSQTSSTSQGASSQSSQSSQSPQVSPSATSSTSTPTSTSTTTDPSPSDSSTSKSPAASSSSVPSSFLIPLASSNPSVTPRPSSTPKNVPANPSTTVATITSALSSQALSPSESQSSSTRASFLQNKPAMIAVFTSAGVFVIVVVFILGIVALRWKRRKDLIESALDFSPTTEHLVNDDDYSGGGRGSALISRSSGSLSSDGARGTRPPRVPSIVLGAGLSVPALTPAPIPASVPPSVPAHREMQQRGPGPGPGYINDRWLDRGETSGPRYAYGNSAQPYYDTVRQQQPPPPSQQQQQKQQQLQYQPQQQPRPPRWQQQEERPLPLDLPTDVGPYPSSLMPSYQRDTAVFNVPFAAAVTKPSRLSVDGGLGGGAGGAGVDRTWGSRTGRKERRQTQQVPLPPPPKFPRKIPDTPERNDEAYEGLEDIVKVDENGRRNQPRVLKVVNG